MAIHTCGAVAGGHDLTVRAAKEILQDGGNAFDAVLAGLAAACICEPIFTSLGGGGFLMAKSAEDSAPILYDFFAAAPGVKRPKQQLDFHPAIAEFGTASQEFHIGAGASAVPGMVPGFFAIHNELCNLPVKRIFEPAIHMAKSGLTITKFQAHLLQVVRPIVMATPKAKSQFAPSGSLLREGDIFTNRQIAELFLQLAEEGEDLFRTGPVAQHIVQQNEEVGGHLTLNDLKSYQVVKRAPLHWPYRNTQIFLNPAPAASGPLIAFGLGHLEKHCKDHSPSVLDIANTMTATNEIRDKWTGQSLSIKNKERVAAELEALQGLTPATRGTTHLSVIDSEGNAAAATVTNGEGNGHIVGDYGFMLNNMLGEEDLNPQGFHNWTPKQRLSTMMAPTLMIDPDGSWTALGSGGSNRIRTAILQVITALAHKGLSLENAVSAPRLHLEKCGTMSYEDLLTPEETESLRAAFKDAKAWPDRNFFFGGVHAARLAANGTLEACADDRRSGKTAII